MSIDPEMSAALEAAFGPNVPPEPTTEADVPAWLDAVNKWLDGYESRPKLDPQRPMLLGPQSRGLQQAFDRIDEQWPNVPGLLETVNRLLKVLFDIEPEEGKG